MRVEIDNDNGVTFCVFLNGEYQSTAIEADSEESFVIRMIRNDEGEIVLDDDNEPKTEFVQGIVEIIHIDDVLRENIERVY